MAAAEMMIPIGPVYREKSGSRFDSDTSYTSKMLTWREAALEEAVDALRRSPEYENLQDYISWVEGSGHWRADRPIYRSRFRDNRIAKARIESIAYLTDIKPTLEIRTQVEAYKKQAEIIRDVIHSEWATRRMAVSLVEAVDHALLGTAYWKIGATMPGALTVTALGADAVLPIQEGRTLQESSGILYRTFKPVSYFYNLWPDRSEGIENEAAIGMLGVQSNQYTRPWNINEYTWNTLSPAMRYHMSRRTPRASVQDMHNAFPVVELQEYWIEDWHRNETGGDVIVKDPYLPLQSHNYWYVVKPGGRLYPRKRLIVFAGDRVMYDGPSPYWHGLYPFAKLRLNPVVWASGGLSRYRDLIPLNQAINEIGAGTLDVVKRAINPQLISKDGAVSATSWERFFPDMPGGKLRMTPMANPMTDVRYMQPPDLPAYVGLFAQYIQQAFKEHSGEIDVSSMAKKKQMPGADTVEAMRSSMSTPYRLETKFVEYFLEDAGVQAAALVPQYFTRAQRMRLLGPDGITLQDFDYRPGEMMPWSGPPEEFHKNFSCEVIQGSSHGAAKDRQKQVAVILRRQGDISRKELHRQMEIGNSEQILGELKEEQESGTGPVGPKGRTPRMSRGQQTGKPF